MDRRKYRQFCAVARGLDAVGDRWTLLLVRELLLGPKRFGDLLDAAPGIGTNLLSDRLRQLEAAGVVERATLPPPAGSSVYRLAEAGLELEPVVLAIGRWGARFMSERRPDDHLAPGAYFIALRARFSPERGEPVSEAYEFRIGHRVFEVRLDGKTCSTGEGGASNPAAVFTMLPETLDSLFFGRLSAEDALESGAVIVAGDSAALARFLEKFPRPRQARSPRPDTVAPGS